MHLHVHLFLPIIQSSFFSNLVHCRQWCLLQWVVSWTATVWSPIYIRFDSNLFVNFCTNNAYGRNSCIINFFLKMWIKSYLSFYYVKVMGTLKYDVGFRFAIWLLLWNFLLSQQQHWTSKIYFWAEPESSFVAQLWLCLGFNGVLWAKYQRNFSYFVGLRSVQSGFDPVWIHTY